MVNLAVFFGGKSLESDISVITAMQCIRALNVKYKIFPIYIKDKMYLMTDVMNVDNYINFNEKLHKEVTLINGEMFYKKRNKYVFLDKIDCALMCTHGASGENGIIQGYLDMANIPYTSSKVLASSVFMSKYTTKLILKSLGINFIKSIKLNNIDQVDDVIGDVEYPVIVKPESLGSSIGISIANDDEQLKESLDVAFKYDRNVIIEKALTNYRELNIACYKKNDDLLLSEIDEPKVWREFLTFEDKYITSGDFEHQLPAQLTLKQEQDIIKITKKVYESLNCDGVIRLDFLLDAETNKLYLNEINSIPGSLAFYLFRNKGLSFSTILDDLINQALNKVEVCKIEEYKTKVLENYKTHGLDCCKGVSKMPN